MLILLQFIIMLPPPPLQSQAMRSKVRKKNYDNLVGRRRRRVIGGHWASAEVHQLFGDFFGLLV